MPKVNSHDSDDNSLQFVSPGMIFAGSQLVTTPPASPRRGRVPDIAEAHTAKVNTVQPGWLPGQFLVNQWDSL